VENEGPGNRNSWRLIVTPSPWNANIQIAGYVSVDVLENKEAGDYCASVGYDAVRANQQWWAHSCTSISCGYGVIWPGENYRPQFTYDWEGRTWTLVVDISKVLPGDDFMLAGYISP
jgi:hypothetical protein